MKLRNLAVTAMMLAMAQLAEGQAMSGKALAIYAPRPQYPYEARSKGVSGSGLFALNVNQKTGLVRSVTVARSTGSPILDNAAKAAFKQWRFQPPVPLSKVEVPIRFR